ncbi:hypothetical protein FA15DRAFT_560142, partial [Coprinopsis marcescibilis]
IQIYTDRSGYKGGIGAAVVLYKGNNLQPSKVLRYHLGKEDSHSTHKAEAVGTVMATYMAVLTGASAMEGGEKLTLYIDCQSVIQSLESTKPGPAQYLLNKFHRIMDTACNKGPREKKMEIQWISAHSKVEGNECIDREAKLTAKGIHNNTPALLRPR